MADGWLTDGGYSPNQFYTASSDKTGDRITYRVNVPGDVGAELIRLVQSGKVPYYRTVQDVWRDALYHRLRWVADLVGDPELQEAVAIMRRQALIDRRLRQLEQQKHYVDSLELLLRTLRSTGDQAQMLEVLEEQDPAALPEAFRERAVEVIRNYREEEANRVR